MFVRAYLRASTKEQDAQRARAELEQFAAEQGHKIAAVYVENESGATLKRPRLMELINDAHEGDVILVEQIDRLARLNHEDWEYLKRLLAEKNLAVVSKEIPTSYMALQSRESTGFTDAILRSVNAMLLDMLAAVARKDYEDRRRRQSQGIAKAKSEGRYTGRSKDHDKRRIIASLLRQGLSYTEVQNTAKCSRQLIANVAKELKCPTEAS
ncbi:recombinase family protein [Oceanimonas baumannii]|uniref:recombinase family protein n=1 Tax=Oceanimonas baumannii TaxID=129578 RepID=UPI003A8F7F06